MTKTLKLSFTLLFIFQLAVAAGFELAHDEAYYWLYSRNMDWGFFDHPPFVGAVIRLFSFFGHSELAVRVGFIGLQFATLLVLWTLTAQPWVTFLLFFSFPLASFTGLLALPDIPLLFMSALYCFQLKRYFQADTVPRSVALGLIIGALFYAKYHGVLLILFTLVAVPSLLLRRSFYVTAASALLIFSPHLLWQYHHEFSTLRYHFLERPGAPFSLPRSLEFLGLQVILSGVLAGPVVWYAALKKNSNTQFDRTLKFVAVGSVVFFLLSSFSKRVEANWTIYLAVPLIVLSADAPLWTQRWARRLLVVSFVFVVFARILFVFPPERSGLRRLKEFHGWRTWATSVSRQCGSEQILANTYQIASKLSFYLQAEVPALNYQSRKNQFDYWRFDQKFLSDSVCYLTDKRGFAGERIETPEGKSLRLVKNQSLRQLWELKSRER